MALQNERRIPHSADSTTGLQDVNGTISHVPSDDVDDTIDSSISQR